MSLSKYDLNAIKINLFGITLWTFIWFYFDIGTIVSTRNNDIALIYWSLVCIFLLNIHRSDIKVGQYEDECRLKTTIESHARSVISIIITLAFCAQIIQKNNSRQIRSVFFTLLSISLLNAMFVLMEISVPKTADEIRTFRKIEGVFMNISVVYIINEDIYAHNFIENE